MTEAIAISEAAQHAVEVIARYHNAQRSWLLFGLAASEFNAAREWAELGFPSFDAWRKHSKMTRSKVYNWMRLAEQLKALMPLERVPEITQQNARTLLFASSVLPADKLQREEIYEAAATQTSEEFFETVQNIDTKLWETVEVYKVFQVRVPKTLYDVMWGDIEEAKTILASDSTTQALEFIFSEFRHAQENNQGRQGDS